MSTKQLKQKQSCKISSFSINKYIIKTKKINSLKSENECFKPTA